MRSHAYLVLAVLALAACGDNNDDNHPIDARTDAAVVDAGIDGAVIDAPMIDGAVIDGAVIDGAVIDAPDIDAAMIDAPTIDTPPMTDASTVGQLQTAHDTADGTGLTLPIEGATVTYVKAALGTDPAGFTVQASMTGPALFIAVDPATLNPPAVPGDVVSFTITAMGSLFSMREATAITGYTRLATGANLGALVQDLTATTDLVTAVQNYESELATGTGVLMGTFANSGSGGLFQKIQLSTTGVPADVNLKLRTTSAIIDSLDLVPTCHVAVHPIPIVRNVAEAQFMVLATSELTVTGCPAPTVVSAGALSPTSVVLTFSRRVDATSVLADASQFTFTGGLTASAVSITGRTVTVTTSAQTGGMSYTVTVASSVHDQQGTALGTPSTATFTGFLAPAVLRINEINANITGSCDLIELRVLSGGSTINFRLTERTGSSTASEMNMTLPAAVVATNDIIVVHTNSGNATCNPGTAVSETTSITQQPVATFTRNYDTAWDFWDTDTGLTATDNVFTLFNPAGVIVDAVLVANAATGTAAAGSETAAETVRAADQWRNMDGSLAAPNFYVDDAFRGQSVLDLDGTGTVNTGTSIQRVDDTDDNNLLDWSTGAGPANTFGLRNVGQSAL